MAEAVPAQHPAPVPEHAWHLFPAFPARWLRRELLMFESRRVLLRTIERMQRDHANHVNELLTVVAHLSGRPLPAYVPPVIVEPDEDAGRYVARPELDADS